MGIPLTVPPPRDLTPPAPDPRGVWVPCWTRYLDYGGDRPMVWLCDMTAGRVEFAVDEPSGWLTFFALAPGGSCPVPHNAGWRLRVVEAGALWSLIDLRREGNAREDPG